VRLATCFQPAVFIILGFFAGCREESMPHKTIEQVQQEQTERLMSMEGVVGTGIGEFNGKPCIKVFVSQKTAELEKQIPDSLESFPVVIEETGEFEALDSK